VKVEFACDKLVALTQIKCYRAEKLGGGEVRSLTQDNGYRRGKAKIDEFSEQERVFGTGLGQV
jgi:hypothetical protein